MDMVDSLRLEKEFTTIRRPYTLEDDAYPLELTECDPDYIECRVEKYVLIIGCPILIVLSLIGNSVTFSVMMRPKLRRTATAIFIASLAVMDTIANVTGLSRHFILKTWQTDVRQMSPVSCSVHRFILYLSLDTSSWLLAIISIERFIAVCKPQKHRYIKTISMAFKIVATLIIVQVGFNMHVFWTRGKHWETVVDSVTNRKVMINCGYTSEHSRYFWLHNQSWMSTLWYCIAPFITMLVMNIFIIRRLRQLKDSALTRESSMMSATGITKQANSMTRMLLCVTIYFMVVTTPIFICTMFQSLLFFHDYEVIDNHTFAKMELLDSSLTIFLYLNHSINFFLYCLTGRRFRRELNCMLGRFKSIKKRASVKKPSLKKQPSSNEVERNALKADYHALTVTGKHATFE